MTPETFGKLSTEQQWTMAIAHDVRNCLEHFHGGKDGIIPDSVMPELNRRLRHCILRSVYSLMHIDRPGCAQAVGYAIQGVPDYWELPELSPEEQALRDEGYSPERYEAYEAVEPQIEAWFKTGRRDAE